MIPNRDSMPQNHPKPKDAVSNTVGGDASMAGSVVFFTAAELSIFITAFSLSCEAVAAGALTKNTSRLKHNRHRRPKVHPVFFMPRVLSFLLIGIQA